MNGQILRGKTALITGSYRNLGGVTAETLASFGANIILNDLLPVEQDLDGARLLEKIKSAGVEAVAIPADLSKAGQIQSLKRIAIEQIGGVDILVNNAGPFNMDPYLHLSEEKWDQVMDVNLKAIFLTAREFAPQMKTLGWGRIINMSAGSAYVRNHNVYTLAKVGVQVITESLALELGPEITVNAISPGQIYESLPNIAEHDPTFGERYTERSPLKRLVTRNDIAQLIAMICTPAFDTMTGMTIRLDGGAELPRF